MGRQTPTEIKSQSLSQSFTSCRSVTWPRIRRCSSRVWSGFLGARHRFRSQIGRSLDRRYFRSHWGTKRPPSPTSRASPRNGHRRSRPRCRPWAWFTVAFAQAGSSWPALPRPPRFRSLRARVLPSVLSTGRSVPPQSAPHCFPAPFQPQFAQPRHRAALGAGIRATHLCADAVGDRAFPSAFWRGLSPQLISLSQKKLTHNSKSWARRRSGPTSSGIRFRRAKSAATAGLRFGIPGRRGDG
jgi:hypothetical protein